ELGRLPLRFGEGAGVRGTHSTFQAPLTLTLSPKGRGNRPSKPRSRRLTTHNSLRETLSNLRYGRSGVGFAHIAGDDNQTRLCIAQRKHKGPVDGHADVSGLDGACGQHGRRGGSFRAFLIDIENHTLLRFRQLQRPLGKSWETRRRLEAQR